MIEIFPFPESQNYGHVIFNHVNSDTEFLVCLVHLLMQLINGISIVGCSTWYSSDSIAYSNNADIENRTKYQKLNEQIRCCADSLWVEIISCKKQLLEDVFKVQLSPNFASIAAIVEPICVKTWTYYNESETNGSASSHWGKVVFSSSSSGGKDSVNSTSSNASQSFQHQISIKLNKMSRTSVLGRLSSSASINTGSGSTSFPAGIGGSRLVNNTSIEVDWFCFRFSLTCVSRRPDFGFRHTSLSSRS